MSGCPSVEHSYRARRTLLAFVRRQTELPRPEASAGRTHVSATPRLRQLLHGNVLLHLICSQWSAYSSRAKQPSRDSPCAGNKMCTTWEHAARCGARRPKSFRAGRRRARSSRARHGGGGSGRRGGSRSTKARTTAAPPPPARRGTVLPNLGRLPICTGRQEPSQLQTLLFAISRPRALALECSRHRQAAGGELRPVARPAFK